LQTPSFHCPNHIKWGKRRSWSSRYLTGLSSFPSFFLLGPNMSLGTLFENTRHLRKIWGSQAASIKNTALWDVTPCI
jgi:hypothetical protein